jgi:SAM-dependent methyltransferase
VERRRVNGGEQNPSQGGGYDPSFYSELVRLEDRHFWFQARNRVLTSLVRRAVSALPAFYRVLEIGCGDGNVLQAIESVCEPGSVTGMDLHGEGLRYARRRTRCGLVQGDVSRSPFGVRFHVVGMFDVLEHVPDDVGALREVSTLIEPGGTLLITVPAHRNLWSYFDVASRHCRRYERAELASKLERAGYSVDFLSEYMASTYPLMWIQRRLVQRRPSAGAGELAKAELRIVPVLNFVLKTILFAEAWWLARGHKLPFGSSLVAVARPDRTAS